jgi:hypothetical protein
VHRVESQRKLCRAVWKLTYATIAFWVMATAISQDFRCLGENIAKPRILFLHVRVERHQITLIDSTTRPGFLKPTRAGTLDELHYRLISLQGDVLWRGAVADPLIHRTENQEMPGKLGPRIGKVDAAEITVRIPEIAEAKRVEFYRERELAEGQFFKDVVGSISLQ